MRGCAPIALGLVLVSGCMDLELERSIPAEDKARIQAARAKVESAPGDVEAKVALGALYLHSGQLFEAADVLKAVTDQNPAHPLARAQLTQAYVGLGYFLKSLEQLKACLDNNPEHPECLLQMGGLLRSEGSQFALTQSRRVFKRFLAAAPGHDRAKDVERTIAELDEQLGPDTQPDLPSSRPASQPASRPASAPAAPVGGDVAMIPGHDAADGEEVGELNEFGMAFMRALQKTRENDAPGAEAAFRAALQIEPDDPSALAGLAEALYAQKKNEQAAQTAEKAYRIEPTHAQVLWIYGRIMLETGRDPKAGAEAWRTLVKTYPDIAERLGIKRALEQMKRFGAGP